MKINISKYFELRGKLTKTESVIIGLVGLFTKKISVITKN